MTTRCALGDMARVARSTTGCACTQRDVGRVLYCHHLLSSEFGPWWALSAPETCKHCGCFVYGYLDADLEPIRPPAVDEAVGEARPVEVVPA